MANYRKEPLIVLKYLNNCLFLNTCEQMLVVGDYIKIQEQFKDFHTPPVIRSTMVYRVC